MVGCNQWSTNSDIFPVMLLQLDTIGLIPIGMFCRKYSLEGDNHPNLQNFNMCVVSSPFSWSLFSFRLICFLSSFVML